MKLPGKNRARWADIKIIVKGAISTSLDAMLLG
jgi:hypothetical protein